MSSVSKALFLAAALCAGAALAQGETPPPLTPAPETPPPVMTVPPVGTSAPAAVSPAPAGDVEEPAVEPPRARLNRLTIAPLNIFLISIAPEFERAIRDNVSLYVGPQLILIGALTPAGLTDNAGNEVPQIYGLILSLGARFFPLSSQRAPKGFWVGPEFRPSYSTSRYTGGRSTSALSFSLLGTVGYTVISDGGFTASFGGGLGYALTFGSATAGGTSGTAVGSGLDIGMHVNLGYAF